jgi:protein FrlC
MPSGISDICAMNLHYVRFPLTRFLDDAAELGLRQVEIWGAAPHFYVGDETLESARRLKTSLRERELELVCFTPEQCVYPINLSSGEARLRFRSIRYFLDCLDMCVEMESPALLVTPGSGYADEDPGAAWSRCVDAMGLLAHRAQALGIRLYLEALPPAYSNVISTARHLRSMLDEVSSPALLGMMDTASSVTVGETIEDYVAQLGNLLRHIHMIDADDGGAHLAWGEGNLPLDGYVADLRKAGYAGSLSLELIGPRYYLDPLPPLRESVDRLRSALA